MKMPPVQKLYEAYSVIADHRFTMLEDEALITSSNHRKVYSVVWDQDIYKSNDNATFWQGYPGYPILTVLLLQKKLPYDKDIISYFKDINWNKLNKEYKANYDAALNNVFQGLALHESEYKKVKEYEVKVFDCLNRLPIDIKRNSKRVIKESEDL